MSVNAEADILESVERENPGTCTNDNQDLFNCMRLKEMLSFFLLLFRLFFSSVNIIKNHTLIKTDVIVLHVSMDANAMQSISS